MEWRPSAASDSFWCGIDSPEWADTSLSAISILRRDKILERVAHFHYIEVLQVLSAIMRGELAEAYFRGPFVVQTHLHASNANT